MPKNVAVTATFAADSTRFERSMKDVEASAREVASSMDNTIGSVEAFGRSMEGAETAGERAERGVRGLTDVLGVAGDAFGLPLGPALEFGGMVTQLGGGISDLAPELARLPGLQGAVAAGQRALNLVMAANPLALVVLAIAALVAAFITAYTTSETFRDIVNGAFGAVVDFATGTFGTLLDIVKKPFNWARDNWQLLLAILTGPIGLAVLAITGHFDTIKQLATGAKDWVVDRFNDLVGFVGGLPGKLTQAARGLFDGARDLATDAYTFITGKFGDLVGFVGGLPGKIKGAAAGMFDGVVDALRSAINTVVDLWNNFGIPSFSVHIPLPFGKSVTFDTPAINLPNIPHLARGGIATSPTLALIGEAGPEAVVPLGAMGNVYHITVNALDARTAGSVVVAAIDSYERRNGQRFARA